MNQQLVGFGAFGSPGVGAAPAFGASPRAAINPWELSSPGVALYRRAYGQEDPGAVPAADLGPAVFGFSVAVLAGIVILGAVVNYQIGKAMAPDKASESKWAWGNAIGGTIFPPVTIGLALLKNYG